MKCLRSRQYKAAFVRLRNQNWDPDVIISQWLDVEFILATFGQMQSILSTANVVQVDADIFTSANKRNG